MPRLRTYFLICCAFALLLLPLLTACNAAPTTESPADREALIALYYSANGEEWDTPWQSGAPMSEWQGVTVDSNGRVVELDLGRNDLRGHLPPELGNLSHLKVLDLTGNQLSGKIPAELGNLANLGTLGLANNQLIGEIPAELGNLANLRRLAPWR